VCLSLAVQLTQSKNRLDLIDFAETGPLLFFIWNLTKQVESDKAGVLCNDVDFVEIDR